jgi:hypothetical protein
MTPKWLYWPAAAASAWEPSDLTSLIAWYKADAISGLSNNDPVSTWSDSSTSGWDATASSGDRPTYITNAQNSLPIVRFSGSNHLSLGSRDLFRNVGGGTIYAVIKNDATNQRCGVMFASAGPSSTLARFTMESGILNNTNKYGAGGRRLDADSFRSIATSASINTNWRLLGAVADWTGSVLTVYLDAVQDGQDTSFHGGGSTSDTATNSVHTTIGATGTNNNNTYDGDIAEIVVVHEALSTGDREKLEGYLAWKWGLEANLPNGHPYENAAP